MSGIVRVGKGDELAKPSLYELEYERPLAVILAVVPDAARRSPGEVAAVLARHADGLQSWAHLLAARLSRDETWISLVLELHRRGLKPRRELLEEARTLLKGRTG